MSNISDLVHRAAICKQVGYDLLVRTVVRLSPDLAIELQKSAQEFLAENKQDTIEKDAFFAETVEIVVNALVENTNNQTNQAKKESNHE